MISFLTTDDLRGIQKSILLEDQRTMLRRASARGADRSTFLSHSSQDVDLLPGVVKILENHGGSVYIDKVDPNLPPYTNRDTALALRGQIALCSNFILFATVNSKDSRWVPWELGLADGLKRHERVAILPAVESSIETTWPKQEYLGIYDRVMFGDLEGETQRVWMVYNQERNTATRLDKWLAR